MIDQINEVLAVANKFFEEADKDSVLHYVLEVDSIGAKYTRIVRRDIWKSTGEKSGASAYGFIKNDDLTLWKAAGWKAPAKNKARGVLSDLTNVSLLAREWRYSIG